MSDWSVFDAPFWKTGCLHMTRSPLNVRSRRMITTFIGSALSVIATRSGPMSVGVVPEPACV